MVQKVFLAVFDMSIVASIVILAVLVVRLFLKRAPKIYSYLLWAVVLFRLLCPFSVESKFSIIPEQAQNIPQDVALETSEYVSPLSVVDAAQRAVGDTLNGGIESVWVRLDLEDVGQKGISMASHLQVWLLFAGVLWPIGMAGMIGYSVMAYVKLRRKLIGAVSSDIAWIDWSSEEVYGGKQRKRVGNKVYLADHIDSPFVMGIVQPKIYLPSSLAEAEREYIILHEKYHIRRGDHIIKFFGFLALCIHWFNPLVWLAFVQAAKDMEMSCDEAVIRIKGEQIRATYTASLLKLATGKQIFAGMPLAFGEGDTKGRIKNIAKWKKPKLWICMVAGFFILVVTVICVLNPKPGSRMAPSKVVGEYDVSRLGGAYLESGNPAYEIGANIYGKPVFADADKAFKAMKEEYKDAIAFIREQFDLRPISKQNYNAYKKYGAQVVTEDESLRKRCVTVAQFLDVYENSFEYGGTVVPVVEGGLLGYATVPTTEENYVTLSKDTVFAQGTSYVTYACQYMSPLSSTLSTGDDGYRYVVGENTFTKIHRSSGNETVYNVTWGWQPFPWSDEEYCDLYAPSLVDGFEVSKYYEEMWYQPITDSYCLLWMDGQLSLMKLNMPLQKTPYVWTVYLLQPE